MSRCAVRSNNQRHKISGAGSWLVEISPFRMVANLNRTKGQGNYQICFYNAGFPTKEISPTASKASQNQMSCDHPASYFLIPNQIHYQMPREGGHGSIMECCWHKGLPVATASGEECQNFLLYLDRKDSILVNRDGLNVARRQQSGSTPCGKAATS